MKKINALFLLLFVLGISFASCTRDFEDGGNYNGSNSGIEENGGGSEDGDNIESTGDYWPAAVGNQWILDQNGTEVSMKIIATEGDYFKFDQLFGTGEGVEGTAFAYLKKTKGNYLIKIAELSFDYGEDITGKMTGYEYVFFKDYLAVNESWTGNFSQTTTFNIAGLPPVTTSVSYTGTILEKASSVTIGTIVYNDVIKFKFHQEAKILDQATTSSDTEYWIAKNIGVIKFATGSTISTLKTYDVKK